MPASPPQKRVVEIVAPFLGWGDSAMAEELDAYRRIAQLEYVARDRPVDDQEAARWAANARPRWAFP